MVLRNCQLVCLGDVKVPFNYLNTKSGPGHQTTASKKNKDMICN